MHLPTKRVAALSKSQTALQSQTEFEPASVSSGSEDKDYFMVRDGVRYAGVHLIIDIYGASHLDILEHVEGALRDAVTCLLYTSDAADE